MFKKQFAWILSSSLLLPLLAVPAMAEELTVDEIIAKNIETLGGMDALKGVKSARMKANINMNGMELPMTMIFKRPHMIRVETEFQGMKMVQAYDGEKGWMINPMMGSNEPTLLAEDQLKQIEDQSDFDGPLVDYKEKGHTVELVGKEDVEGTEAYKLKVTKKNGDIIYTYLDTEYFLVFKQEGRIKMQGQEINATTNLSDYKEVGDIVMAHAIESLPEGAPAGVQITLSDVELNIDVDESLFAMPEVSSEKEEAEEKTSEG